MLCQTIYVGIEWTQHRYRSPTTCPNDMHECLNHTQTDVRFGWLAREMVRMLGSGFDFLQAFAGTRMALPLTLGPWPISSPIIPVVWVTSILFACLILDSTLDSFQHPRRLPTHLVGVVLVLFLWSTSITGGQQPFVSFTVYDATESHNTLHLKLGIC